MAGPKMTAQQRALDSQLAVYSDAYVVASVSHYVLAQVIRDARTEIERLRTELAEPVYPEVGADG